MRKQVKWNQVLRRKPQRELRTPKVPRNNRPRSHQTLNAVFPGVAQGVCRFQDSRKGRAIAWFATCGNKLYMTGREWHAAYVASGKGVMKQGGPPT